MKYVKGFTLIELLGVIIIIGTIFILVFPNIINLLRKSEIQLDEATKKIIIDGTNDFLGDNNIIKEDYYCIKISNLISQGYITSDMLKSLKNKDYYIKMIAKGSEIDYVVVDNCSPMIYDLKLSSNSSTISIQVVNDLEVDEISKFYYSLDNVNFIESNENIYIFSNLKKNTEYTVYVKVENEEFDVSDVYSKEIHTKDLNNPVIQLVNTPTLKVNGYLKRQEAIVTFDDNSLDDPKYFIKTTRDAKTDEFVVAQCGKGTLPKDCASISDTKVLEIDTWYQVDSKVNVTYDMTSSEVANLYAIMYDGTNYTSATVSTISKIDVDSPIITLLAPSIRTNNVIINYELKDLHSGIDSYICKYGMRLDEYIYVGSASESSCMIDNLKTNQTYYYQICSKDNINNKETCNNGEVIPKEIITPTITQTSEVVASGYTWATERTISINYNDTNIDRAEYYLKSSVSSTIGAGVVTATCGIDTNPGDCSSSNVTTLVPNTWYKVVSKTPNIVYNGNGILYALISDGVNISATSTYTVSKISKGIPTSPTITGGSSSWSSSAKTISVSTASTEASGISKYQYYISTSNSSQTGGSWIDCQTSTSISTNGTRYIYFRAIANNGKVSSVSNTQTTMIDTANPSVTVSVSGKNATFTMTDAVGIIGYGVNQSSTVEPSYTAISSTTSTAKTWTASAAGTYYVWVKDNAGRTAKASFTIPITAFTSAVTYISNGSTYKENIVIGTSVLSPTSFTPTRSGATFKGWSSSSSSTTVLTSKVADGQAMTLYAVFKYNDTSVTMSTSKVWDPGWDIFPDYLHVTFYSGIDMAKYSGLTVYVSATTTVNHRGGSWKIYLNAGGASSIIMNPSCDWSVPQVCPPSSYNGTLTLTFTGKSGTTSLYSSSTTDGTNGIGGIQLSSLKLIGRTVVG